VAISFDGGYDVRAKNGPAALELTGKTVLLTGASSGLGPHIARRLRSAGAKLILSARNRDALQELGSELGESKVIPADLARRGEAERLAAEAGPVEIVVSNAGVPASGALDDLPVEAIDRALEVNLRAGIVLTRLLLPAMLKRGSGQVVLMASMAGLATPARLYEPLVAATCDEKNARIASPGVADMLKRWIVISKSKSSWRALCCTASTRRTLASMPSVARFLM